MKLLPRILLALYLFVLFWLLLFKLSFDIPSVLNYQAASLNMIPFAGLSLENMRETVYNFVVFIPLGLLLCVNFKQTSFWQKIFFIFVLSLAAEIIQFILAIGITDITDVITNTLGGFLGLKLYDLSARYIDKKKQDQFIVIACAILLLALIILRVFVFRVSYHSAS